MRTTQELSWDEAEQLSPTNQRPGSHISLIAQEEFITAIAGEHDGYMLFRCFADPIRRQDGRVAKRVAKRVDEVNEILRRLWIACQSHVIGTKVIGDSLGVV